MSFSKPITFKSEAYRAFIRSKDCYLCNTPGPSIPHHESMDTGSQEMGGKCPDTMTVPLCVTCHDCRTNYPYGARGFYGALGLDPVNVMKDMLMFATEYLKNRPG